MKSKANKILLGIGIFFLFLFVIGCTPSSNSNNVAESPSEVETEISGEVVELEFWDMVWGPPEYIDTARQVVEEFNEAHPNIKVNYQSTPWNNWYQTFSSAIAAGIAPDISTGAGYQAFEFYDMGAILPVDDLIKEWEEDGKLDDFLPGTVETLHYDGHYVSIPWGMDVRLLYYRKSIFEKEGIDVPTNWTEFRNAAAALTNDEGRYGLVIPSDNGGVHFLFSFFLNNGGGFFNSDKSVNMLNERNMDAVQFLADLVSDGSVNPASAGYQGDDAIRSFGQGDAAMFLNNPGLKNNLSDISDDIGIMKPLAGPHGDFGTVRWVNNIMVYKQTDHPKESMQFLKWWSENSLPIFNVGHTGQLPVRKSFAADDYFQNHDFLGTIIDEWLPVGKTLNYPYPSAFPQLNEIEGEGVMFNMVQELLMGEDIIPVMEQANQTITEIMNK